MAIGDQKVAAPNELTQLQGLLGILGGGGQTQTVTPTNTAPLQGVLSNLQGIDYNALLQSIFQQAAGQIPGMQSAYGRAVGARSSGNAPMQAALQELLKQTTLEGQKQVAAQQNQNLQTQTTAASNLIGKKQTTANQSQLGQLAAMIGLAQAATKLGGYKTVQEMLGAVTGTAAPTEQLAAPIREGVAVDVPQMSMAPIQSFNVLGDASGAAPVQDYSQDGGMSTAPAEWFPEFNVADYVVPQAPAPEMSMAPEEWFQSPDVMSYF